MRERVDVTICVLTYRRHAGLERLLRALDGEGILHARFGRQVLVVDNNPEGDARVVVERCGGAEKSMHYVHEPRAGIAAARNAALDAAAPHSEWVAFLDDDEAPEPGWIDALLRAQARYGADVLTGPVLPRFDSEVPSWVTRGGFFATRRHRTGARLRRAFTGNVLFRADLARRLGLRFDDRLNFMGGEDSHFFERLSRAGYPALWVDEAVVREWIPAERIRPEWLIRRKLWSGHVDAFIRLDAVPGSATRLALRGVALAWVALGVGAFAWGLAGGRHWRLRGRRAIAYGRGLIAGSSGKLLEDYARGAPR